jgi:hypothetical protein
VKGKIEDPEYRARVADLLWVKRKGAAGGREYKVESWRNRK